MSLSLPLYPTLVLLAFASFTYAQSTFDPTLICSLIANGTTINDPRACNTWIQCVDGKPISGQCTDQLFFDKDTNACVPAANITCLSSNPCASTPGVNGFVADPYSCNGYYYCLNGVGSHGVCSSGMNFNPGTQDCIRNFDCSNKQDPDSYCNIVPDDVFIQNSSNCSAYQLCWNGQLLNGSCPSNYYFNAAKGACDYSANVVCLGNNDEQPTLPAEGRCQHAGDFVADNRTCTGYYYCKETTTNSSIESADVEMTMLWGECPDGRFYDPVKVACVPRTQYACPYDRCVGLGLSHIQLANESNDNCVGYAICQNGIKIGSGTCPTGEYFDVMTQFCTQLEISYPSCVLASEETTSEATSADTTTMSTATTDD